MSDVGMPHHHLQPLHPIQPQHMPPMDPPLCACGDLATFAMTGSCRPTHCMAHREPGMMEVKKCVCGKARPSYALPGAAEATHCARYHDQSTTVITGSQSICYAPCGGLAKFWFSISSRDGAGLVMVSG